MLPGYCFCIHAGNLNFLILQLLHHGVPGVDGCHPQMYRKATAVACGRPPRHRPPARCPSFILDLYFMFTIVPKTDDAATIFYRITLHIPHDEAVAGPQRTILEEGVEPALGVGPEPNRRRGLLHGRLIHGGVHYPPSARRSPAHRQTSQLYVPLGLRGGARAEVATTGSQADPPLGGETAFRRVADTHEKEGDAA